MKEVWEMRKLWILFFVAFFTFHEKTASPVTFHPGSSEGQSTQLVSHDQAVDSRSTFAKLDVPAIRQLPELYNGCEVTSLAMLLHSLGSPVDKLQLAKQIKKDSTPFKGTSLTQISQWGNPNEGFVGDITGKTKGYGVYNGPIHDLLVKYVGDQAVNLSGSDFSTLEWVVDQGHPIVVWATATFKPTSQWVTWKKGDVTVRATFQEHAVLLVGYDDEFVYINDPLTGQKTRGVNKQSFIKSWEQLGKQAVTAMAEENRSILAQK